jgi:beta-galactosidase
VFGEGAAYYLGTSPKQRYTKSLLQRVYEEADVRPTADVPPGIDAVRRKTEDASFLYLLNHTQEAVEVWLPSPGRDLLTGKEHGSNLVLDPLEVAILKESGYA